MIKLCSSPECHQHDGEIHEADVRSAWGSVGSVELLNERQNYEANPDYFPAVGNGVFEVRPVLGFNKSNRRKTLIIERIEYPDPAEPF